MFGQQIRLVTGSAGPADQLLIICLGAHTLQLGSEAVSHQVARPEEERMPAIEQLARTLGDCKYRDHKRSCIPVSPTCRGGVALLYAIQPHSACVKAGRYVARISSGIPPVYSLLQRGQA
jgi:hypothetical protein